MQKGLNKDPKRNHPLAWSTLKCIMPLQFCSVDRKSWIPLKNESVSLLNIYGLQVPLGNCDYFSQSYRPCKLSVTTTSSDLLTANPSEIFI